MSFFLRLMEREIRNDLRKSFQVVIAPAFFVLVALMFVLAMGADGQILKSIGSGVIMVASLLASLLPLSHIYRDDMEDGTFDLLQFSSQSLPLYCFGKIAAHWLLAGFPLIVIAPLLAMAFQLDIGILTMLSALIPTTLLFVLIGQMMAALGGRSGGASVLIALLAMPLYVPVLIFGSAVLGMAQAGMAQNTTAPLLFLWAGLSITLPIAPMITAAILKMQQG